MRTTIHFITSAMFLLFYGCSDSDDIPTSSERDSVKIVNWKSLKDARENSNNIHNETSNEHNYKNMLPFPTFSNQTTSHQDNRVDDEVDDSRDIENYVDDGYIDNQQDEDLVKNEHLENRSDHNREKRRENQEQEENSDNYQADSSYQKREDSKKSSDNSNYEEKVKIAIQEAMKHYPHPPSPANLTPYDDRERDSYRQPTQEETQSGVGDFPPVPPAMFLNNYN